MSSMFETLSSNLRTEKKKKDELISGPKLLCPIENNQ